MIGGSGRVGGPVVAIFITLTVLIAGCGPSPATPSLVPHPTSSLAPPATAEGPSPSAAPSSAAVQVDAALLGFVPGSVDGVPLTFDPGTSATIAADPSVAPDAASLAVALAIVPGASAADDLAVVSVVRLRDPAKDDAWFRDWRDTYDQAACSPAGGLVGNAEAEIGGGTVYIGSCAGGVRTYHTRLLASGIVVSITALGSRRLGEKVMAGLKR